MDAIRVSSSVGRMPEIVLPGALPWGRRVLKHPRLMQSNRLALLVLVTNVLVFGWGRWSEVADVALVAQANFALGILVRQQLFVNGLSRLVMKVPKSWPLRLRWALAKGYHLGGLHVGAAVCGTVWFLGLTVVATGEVGLGLLLVYYLQALVLLAIVMTARPGFRARRHDLFERIHRFGGWGLSLLFWIGTVLLVDERRGAESLPAAMTSTPTVWVLTLMTLSSLVPWMLLRRIPTEVVRPSSHVALVRSDRSTPVSGCGRNRSHAGHPPAKAVRIPESPCHSW